MKSNQTLKRALFASMCAPCMSRKSSQGSRLPPLPCSRRRRRGFPSTHVLGKREGRSSSSSSSSSDPSSPFLFFLACSFALVSPDEKGEERKHPLPLFSLYLRKDCARGVITRRFGGIICRAVSVAGRCFRYDTDGHMYCRAETRPRLHTYVSRTRVFLPPSRRQTRRCLIN